MQTRSASQLSGQSNAFHSSVTQMQQGSLLQAGLFEMTYMRNIWVPSVVQFLLLLPGVLGGVDLENASRGRTLLRNLCHVVK